MSKQIQFTWKEFDEAANIMASIFSCRNFDGVYGIPRGGLVLAVKLSHKLKLPLRDSVTPTTLVVDDISDSGETLLPFIHHVTATIHYVIGSRVTPDVYVFEKTKGDWIVYPWEI